MAVPVGLGDGYRLWIGDRKMKIKVAVIIPFFQRHSGILKTAVRSVLEQKDVSGVEIIIVDDCSPVDPVKELNELIAQYPGQIRMIKMPKNSGQGAARNKGLDSVLPETEYVAFLDSDDEWSPDHLANALCALDRGFDFYFSDFYQLHQQVSAFERAKRIDPTQHDRIEGHEHLHVFCGDMFAQILTGNILGMSTIVYRFRKFPELRFQEDFRSCGEEYLFWLDLSRMTNRIAFSEKRECRYGEGVNTFSGATWGTEGAIRKIHDEIKYLSRIMHHYPLTDELRKNIGNVMDRLRAELIRETLHRVVRGKSVQPKLLVGAVQMDPGLLLSILPLTVRAVSDGIRNKIGIHHI
jgi:succinoglycan biosynthesis protein ExoW